ncbi:hypothetical protein [Alteromonas gilva]|uniref:Twin-arginine translocation signal domain-containing protein n=1 Tax=Alteromonas gilva TaxID=2987522 RepID=A0ABT5L003_9ALTE|nr:hypothetical protein [Alteromonas gilva]MDC8830350.1 hypothetical protein [Alteromonas gilva]
MNTQRSSRREILKKSGAIAGVTIIPSRSVWGACNASGVSGGSKDAIESCTFRANELGGRSPGSWSKFLSEATEAPDPSDSPGGRDETGLNKIHGMFSNYYFPWNKKISDAERLALKKVYDSINNTIRTTTVDLGGDGAIIPVGQLHLESALSNSGGIAWHLASVYLNFKYGFVRLPASYMSPAEYLVNLWAVAHVSYDSYAAFENDVDAQYEDHSMSDFRAD